MKHIKEYKIFEGEYYTDYELQEFKNKLPKFARFIRRFIIQFGYDCVDMSEGDDIQFSFYAKNTNKVLFSIMTGNDEYFVLDSFRNSNNIIVSEIPEYLKTINGIRFNKQILNSDEYEYYITGDVDDVINQIGKDKLIMFASAKKFNV